MTEPDASDSFLTRAEYRVRVDSVITYRDTRRGRTPRDTGYVTLVVDRMDTGLHLCTCQVERDGLGGAISYVIETDQEVERVMIDPGHAGPE